jgi:hypothetical protein
VDLLFLVFGGLSSSTFSSLNKNAEYVSHTRTVLSAEQLYNIWNIVTSKKRNYLLQNVLICEIPNSYGQSLCQPSWVLSDQTPWCCDLDQKQSTEYLDWSLLLLRNVLVRSCVYTTLTDAKCKYIRFEKKSNLNIPLSYCAVIMKRIDGVWVIGDQFLNWFVFIENFPCSCRLDDLNVFFFFILICFVRSACRQILPWIICLVMPSL